jgi:asparagine synthetase B (glutamine-hydrolysing)
VLPSSFPRINFDDKGVCSVCRDYDRWWGNWSSEKPEKREMLEKICKQAKGKHREFDALVPFSGGKDSSYVLYVAQKELGLKCLAYTLDTGYLSDYARNNVDRTCRKLGVEHVYYCLDPELTNRLFALFMKKTGWFCSVCMRAIQMSTFRIAEMYRVPLIIKGSSMRTELPLAHEMFQSGDPAHMCSVLEGEPIAQECKRLCSRGASIQRK